MVISKATRHKLALARSILAKGSWRNDIEVATKIRYTQLTRVQLSLLEVAGLKPDGDFPLAFDYERILGPHLPAEVNQERFFMCLVDLLYNEWAINEGKRYWRRLDQRMRNYWDKPDPWLPMWGTKDKGQPVLVSAEAVQRHANKKVWGAALRAKWCIDTCMVRLVALWDKLVGPFLLESYFGDNPRKKFGSMLRALQTKTRAGAPCNQTQVGFINSLCALAQPTLAENVNSLRSYRHNELHKIGPRVLGAFEHKKTTEYVRDYWKRVNDEHNRVREAMMCAFGIVLATTLNTE